jgi:hypothetical protein
VTAIVSLTTRIGELSATDRDVCFNLLSHYFLDIRRNDFERDFAEKEAVLMLRSETAAGPIVGFSTIMTLPLAVLGRRVRAIFSGDTVVDPRYRFSSGVFRELGSYFLDTLSRFPAEEVYYLLISKGWRTYKLLPSLFRHFSPSADGVSPSERAVISAFGSSKYPDSFDLATGVIRGGAGAPRVRPDGIDAIPTRIDAHTAFFLEANPGYLDGDELVCAGHVTPENFAAPLRRVLAQREGVRDDDRLATVGHSLRR